MIKDTADRKAYDREYYLRNRKVILARVKRNKERLRNTNPDRLKQWAANWRKRNPDHARRYYLAHRAERILAAKIRKENNRDKYRELQRARRVIRRKTDPNYKLECVLRNRFKWGLRSKRHCKNSSVISLIGCSIPDLWIYLESKFESGMTRENHGSVWHIDHIMPCAIFDLSKPEHQKRCFHFSNLQPLFGKDNLRKAARVLTNQFQLI
jgi:hypothetical protein